MDLELKNFSPKIIRCYLDCTVYFVRHFGRSPVEMGEEEIRKYLHYLIKEKNASSINQAYSVIEFFHEVTLGRAWNRIKIPRVKSRKTLPFVLSKQEVRYDEATQRACGATAAAPSQPLSQPRVLDTWKGPISTAYILLAPN